MTSITLRILDGADRGRVFENLSPPVTIGREEGNTIQLNDERVSRFHVKIQDDQDKLVLTDLESTNGTKVNGEDIQLRILRHGDIVSLGRSVILLGTREEIGRRLSALRDKLDSLEGEKTWEEWSEAAALDPEKWADDPELQNTLFNLLPPELPERLSPGQSAELAELLEYFHLRIRELIASVKVKPDADRVTLDAGQWQNLLDIQSRLAGYLRAIGHPEEKDEGGRMKDE